MKIREIHFSLQGHSRKAHHKWKYTYFSYLYEHSVGSCFFLLLIKFILAIKKYTHINIYTYCKLDH